MVLQNADRSIPILVLASASPRRKQILASLGVDAEVIAADIDESALPAEEPAQLVKRLAETKSRAVAATLDAAALSVGADTLVVVDGAVLGKPRDRAEAQSMLERLSGRTHSVLTGVSATFAGRSETCCAETKVTFRELTKADIAREVASATVLDRAGAYGVQDSAALFVTSIVGTYHNVVGLPVPELDELCRLHGFELADWIMKR